MPAQSCFRLPKAVLMLPKAHAAYNRLRGPHLRLLAGAYSFKLLRSTTMAAGAPKSEAACECVCQFSENLHTIHAIVYV